MSALATNVRNTQKAHHRKLQKDVREKTLHAFTKEGSRLGWLGSEAEVLDGVDEERRVFFGGAGIDAVPKVHDVVAAPASAKNLLRAFLCK